MGAGLQPPPLFNLKIVYSYVIEVADSESELGLHGKALVLKIMVFLQIRVTCIFQLNDLYCTTIRENAYINIHPQSRSEEHTSELQSQR